MSFGLAIDEVRLEGPDELNAAIEELDAINGRLRYALENSMRPISEGRQREIEIMEEAISNLGTAIGHCLPTLRSYLNRDPTR